MFSQKDEEEFSKYSTFKKNLFFWFHLGHIFISFIFTRNKFNRLGLAGKGAKIDGGWVHQDRKAICVLSRKYLAFLCQQVNSTCKWFPVQLEACFTSWIFHRDTQCFLFQCRVIFAIKDIAGTAPYLKQKALYHHDSVYTSGLGFKWWRRTDLSNQSDRIGCNTLTSELCDLFKLHHQHWLKILSPGLLARDRYKLLMLTRQKEDNLWHLFISPYAVKISTEL